MMSNRSKYKNVEDAMNIWRDYMVSMGFGYKLGIDLPEKSEGLYLMLHSNDRAYHGSWNWLPLLVFLLTG